MRIFFFLFLILTALNFSIQTKMKIQSEKKKLCLVYGESCSSSRYCCGDLDCVRGVSSRAIRVCYRKK